VNAKQNNALPGATETPTRVRKIKIRTSVYCWRKSIKISELSIGDSTIHPTTNNRILPALPAQAASKRENTREQHHHKKYFLHVLD